jgi:hypothetical protein
VRARRAPRRGQLVPSAEALHTRLKAVEEQLDPSAAPRVAICLPTSRDGGEGPDARRGRASGPRLVLLAALGHRGGAPGVGGRASKAMHCQAPEDTPLAAAGRRDGRPVPAGQRIGAKAKTLFRPQTYFRIPTEDRLWIPEEYVALFVEKGWRRGNQGELAR